MSRRVYHAPSRRQVPNLARDRMLEYPPVMEVHPRARLLQTESAFGVLARARALERAGREVIHLEIGQPDFPTPKHICDGAIQAIRDGKTGYGPTPGIPELREAIAEAAGRERGISIDPSRVIVTPGGKPVIFYTVSCLAGPGDEVIYPDPGFPMYASVIAHCGARPVPLLLREESGFRFDPAELRRLISPRTRLIILNSPQNPTGGVIDRQGFETVAAESRRHGFAVLSDEIYQQFLYDGEFLSPASLEGMQDRTVILDGFSKRYSMTGWRLGYAIVPEALREPFELFQVNVVSCAVTFNQYGALEAIRGSQDCVRAMVAEFRRRRDYLTAELRRMPGVRCTTPAGAFYAFPNVAATGLPSTEVAERLLVEAGVATLAGNSFGPGGDGYLRLSYANSLANLEKAVERMRLFFERLAGSGAG